MTTTIMKGIITPIITTTKTMVFTTITMTMMENMIITT